MSVKGKVRSAASGVARKVKGNKSDPYAKTWWRGKQFDNRTVSALIWAEKQYRKRGKNRAAWSISQGSFSQGSLSAGTHSGSGSVDIGFAGVGPKHRKATVKWLRKAGFAAWAREGAAWGTNNDHCHGILLGSKNAAEGAKDQMQSYLDHRDGLAGNRWDSTWRPDPIPRWSHRRNKPYIPK